MVITPGMVDSVNASILDDRRITIEEIFKQQRISVGTAHKIEIDDFAFLKVIFCCVPKILTQELKVFCCSKNG